MKYILFNANVNKVTVNKLISVLTQINNKGEKEITLLFRSGGGMVNDAITAFNFWRSYPAKKIFWALGNVDSIGVLFFLAGDERFSSPTARFLMHDITYITDTPISATEENISFWVKGLRQDRNAIANTISKATGQSPEKITNLMKKGEILSPEQAKQLGFIHNIQDFKLPENVNLITIQDELKSSN